jgi:hypothetical protein
MILKIIMKQTLRSFFLEKTRAKSAKKLGKIMSDKIFAKQTLGINSIKQCPQTNAAIELIDELVIKKLFAICTLSR